MKNLVSLRSYLISEIKAALFTSTSSLTPDAKRLLCSVAQTNEEEQIETIDAGQQLAKLSLAGLLTALPALTSSSDSAAQPPQGVTTILRLSRTMQIKISPIFTWLSRVTPTSPVLRLWYLRTGCGRWAQMTSHITLLLSGHAASNNIWKVDASSDISYAMCKVYEALLACAESCGLMLLQVIPYLQPRGRLKMASHALGQCRKNMSRSWHHISRQNAIYHSEVSRWRNGG